jgi:hypothetical protein
VQDISDKKDLYLSIGIIIIFIIGVGFYLPTIELASVEIIEILEEVSISLLRQ